MGKSHNHVFIYTYEALPGVFRNQTDQFLEYLKRDGMKFLKFWWEQVGKKLPEESDYRDDEGLSYIIRQYSNGAQAVIITLPPPIEHQDPYFLALIHPRQRPTLFKWRNLAYVYTLSLNIDEDGNTKSLFGEWTPHGQYRHIQSGLLTDLESFLQTIDHMVETKIK